MDDAFANLEDISDEQTLESLFESTSAFPNLDSPHFHDDTHHSFHNSSSTAEAAAAAALLGPLDSAHHENDIFGPSSSTGSSSLYGNEATAGHNAFANSNLFASAQPVTLQHQQPESNASSSSAPGSVQSQQSMLSPAASLPPPSPVATAAPSFSKPLKSPAPQSPSPSMTMTPQSPLQAPVQLIYANKTPATTISVPQSPTVVRTVGTPMQSPQQQSIILNPQSTVITGQQLLQTANGQMLQIQLQPAHGQTMTRLPAGLVTTTGLVSSTSMGATSIICGKGGSMLGSSNGGSMKQPQLLPKPFSPQSQASTTTMTTLRSTSAVASAPSLIFSQQGNVLTTMSGAAAAAASGGTFLINSLGQVVGSTTGQANSPILIQQPNPFIFLRPPQQGGNSSGLQVSQAGQGTILLQQSANVITAQPQVKIITPQGRMQMQQIQTPTGPKLIAVPVGQAFLPYNQGTQLTFNSGGQLVAASMSPSSTLASFVSSPVTMSSSSVISSLASAMPSTSVIASTSVTADNSQQQQQYTKKKKSKKSKKSPEKRGGLDLGELMKDVGLDLEGFGMDETNEASSSQEHQHLSLLSSEGSVSLQSSSGSQLLAQIQQPLPLHSANANAGQQLQLVQGPDGQFVLQSTSGGNAPTLIQNYGDSLSQSLNLLTSPQLLTSMAVNGTPLLQQMAAATASTPTSSPTKNASSYSPPRAPRHQPNNDPNRVPLYEDERLPSGWHRKVSQRKSGASAGRYEVFIIGPSGKRFRSRNELKTFFEKTGEKTLDPEDFDFSPFGNYRSSDDGGGSCNVVIKAEVPSIATATSVPVQVAQRVTPAAVAVNLPTASLGASPVILAPLQQAVKTNENMLQIQSLQEPLPPKSLLESTSSFQQQQQHASLSSQISRETADADAQISQLLETLQKDPQSLAIESEKMADFIKSLAGESDTYQSNTPLVMPQLPNVPVQQQQQQFVFSSPVAVSTPPPQPPQQQQQQSKPAVKPEMTAGTTGFQASFLNSLANSGNSRRVSTDEDLGKQQQMVPQNVVQQVSRGEMVPSSLPPSAVPVPHLTTTGMGGGASSQMRALQNLPHNTRLVKGPNGQYTLQKVQTIELSPEMQQNLRLVQARVQEIEKKSIRNSTDDAELAQLQTRQQQILATGRPVPTPGTPGNLMPSHALPVTVPQQTSLSTATHVVNSNQQTLVMPKVYHSSKPIVTATATAAAAATPILLPSPPPSSTPAAKPPAPAVRYSHNVGNQAIPVTPTATVAAKTSTTTVPPLTDQQRKIVSEFKQKMAVLTPDQQVQFIAQNKAALIRQLDFQPTQLQLLRSNHMQSQQQPEPPAVPVVAAAAAASPTYLDSGSSVATPEQQGIKRTATMAELPQPPQLVKHKKVAWVESQVKKDQNEAVNPNYRTPFRSKEDACKRLLRYHVFDELDASPEDMRRSDENFEVRSDLLLTRCRSMLDKYHFLLLQESTRPAASSEDVMLARMWDTDERLNLTREKEEFKGGKILALPPLPDAWALKYEEVNGHKPPYGVCLEEEEDDKKEEEEEEEGMLIPAADPEQSSDAIPAVSFDEEEEEEEEEEKEEMTHSEMEELKASEKFLGLKFSRSDSGKWMAKNKKLKESQQQLASSSYDEFESIKEEMSRLEKSSVAASAVDSNSRLEDSDDSDEEFSLKDIDSAQAVGAILESNDDEDDFDYGSCGGALGDNESVQNAINSILDLPQGERMETPDLNGLLDSMDDCVGEQQDRDPATEAAVNSIPRF